MDAEWKEGETSREEKLRGRCVPHSHAHTSVRSNTRTSDVAASTTVCVCVYTPMTTNRFSPEQVSVPIFGPPSLSKVLKLRPSQSLTFRSLLLSLNPHLDRERRSYWTWVIKTRGLWFFLWWFLFVLSSLFSFRFRAPRAIFRIFPLGLFITNGYVYRFRSISVSKLGQKFNRNRIVAKYRRLFESL